MKICAFFLFTKKHIFIFFHNEATKIRNNNVFCKIADEQQGACSDAIRASNSFTQVRSGRQWFPTFFYARTPKKI